MKEYIKNGNTDDIKDIQIYRYILKIRLHMWNVKKNYPKNYRYNMPNLQKRRRYNRACARL